MHIINGGSGYFDIDNIFTFGAYIAIGIYVCSYSLIAAVLAALLHMNTLSKTLL